MRRSIDALVMCLAAFFFGTAVQVRDNVVGCTKAKQTWKSFKPKERLSGCKVEDSVGK